MLRAILATGLAVGLAGPSRADSPDTTASTLAGRPRPVAAAPT